MWFIYLTIINFSFLSFVIFRLLCPVCTPKLLRNYESFEHLLRSWTLSVERYSIQNIKSSIMFGRLRWIDEYYIVLLIIKMESSYGNQTLWSTNIHKHTTSIFCLNTLQWCICQPSFKNIFNSCYYFSI